MPGQLVRYFALLAFITGYTLGAFAQVDPAIQQGYLHQNDTTYFLFDEAWYGRKPRQVNVTGSFRGWSQDMEAPEWQLSRKTNSLWSLGIYNPNFATIPIRAEFKFRIDQGEWLSPPAGSPDVIGTNLIFMAHISLPSLSIALLRTGQLWVQTEGFPRSLDPKDYLLSDARGKSFPIAEVLPHSETTCLVIPADSLDIRRIYYLEVPGEGLKSWCSFDGWFQHLYSSKALGATVHPEAKQTDFRIFSPRARQVKLYLYREPEAEAYQEIEMAVDEDGVWEAQVAENLHGVYYDFTVHGFEEPGNHFYETTPVHISDPYARVNLDAWGRSRVWTPITPPDPVKGGRPPMEDVIAYEVHVQDFTDLLPVEDDLKGTLPAFHQSGLQNSRGEPIGFDYLVDLGINVVHLMPVQEFMHYPDDLWQASFKDDPFMQEMGIDEENYQWGYRTSHCFAVENRFRSRGSEPGAEREQFRDLVQAFHEKGIAVIIDIVPNHTAENMDSEPHFFHFNVLDKLYYYRTRDLDHIGEYGNEVKTENRPMVQRWLIDQCQHFIEEFGVDGFRVDLAGQIDRQTLSKLRAALGPGIILYGEPWIGSNDPDFENNPDWDWYKHNSPITFFQDDARNAFKGSPFDLSDKDLHRGYAGGNYREQEKVMLSLSAGFPEDQTPLSGINYLDIHDNWALADRFATEDWDGRKGVDEIRFKIAALLLYTSLGPIVTHGGTEMMRSKGLAPLEHMTKKGKDWLSVAIKSRGDTYNLRKPNQFVWENVGLSGKQSPCDYAGMHAFWRGLNHFRLSEAGQVFRQAEKPSPGYYQWVNTVNPYQLGYLVDERVFVLINVGGEFHDWDEVVLPKGTWKLIGNEQGFDHVQGVKDKKALQTLQGGKAYSFRLEGPGFKVWLKQGD